MDANAPPFNPSTESTASSSLCPLLAGTNALWGTRNELFGDPIDEFKNDGFQLVSGKKKKPGRVGSEKEGGFLGSGSSKEGKMMGVRSKVPFHLPSIPKPQDEYSIRVNNENMPFDHVWLEKSSDGSRYIHPLEKFSVEKFVDRKLVEAEPVKPLALESTPFKFVETVNDLRDLVANLRAVDEFAVDLEHNHYRSFQGLTCLMQISTRKEDFVVDTLRLRMHVGPYLREIFKDPSKRKVMHGADHDILWLQRDFGIYVCNLFDTGQASRVLQLERNSLEYLLHHFCEVIANKEYQNADWRLRPLPGEMIKYAREDTHYLLYIYDIMKTKLLSESSNENDLLLEVYRRSAETCMQLYEKELLNDTSYLYIYGLSDADLNAEQLAVVAGLSQWRDNIARAEDESTGYILPNRTLLEIAKQMPLNAAKLKRLIKTKHPFIENNIHSILGIVRSSVVNSAAFENAAQQLKNARLETSRIQYTGAVIGNIDHDDGMHSFSEPIITNLGPKEFSFGAPAIQSQNARFSPVNRVGEDGELKIIPSSWLSSLNKRDDYIGNQGADRKAENENMVKHIESGVTLPFYYFSGERPTESQALEPHMSCTTRLGEVTPLEDENKKRESQSNGPNEKDGTNTWVQFHPFTDVGSEQNFNSEIEVTEAMSPSDLISSFEKCFPSISESRGSPKGRKLY